VPASAAKLGAMQSQEGDREVSAPGTAPGSQPANSGQPEMESAVAVVTGQPEAGAAAAPATGVIDITRRQQATTPANFTLASSYFLMSHAKNY